MGHERNTLVARLARQRFGLSEHHPLKIRARELSGGLEAGSVVHVCVLGRDTAGSARRVTFVLKQLDAHTAREVAIYAALPAQLAVVSAPRVLARCAQGAVSYLCLEAVTPAHPWPWQELGHSARVLTRLAQLHGAQSTRLARAVADWNYEAELAQRAQQLLAWVEQHLHDAALRRSLPALRRITHALPRLRRQLLAFDALPSVPLHGDVHPGNVIVRQDGDAQEPVLLDWARARIGSPLEDVSSWLQSLSYWEPHAKRRHDSLLATYLAARGLSAPASRDVRDAYWLAAVSNTLAGALHYHLSQHATAGATDARSAARACVADCLRVVRRADACFHLAPHNASSKRSTRKRAPSSSSVTLALRGRNACQTAGLASSTAPSS